MGDGWMKHSTSKKIIKKNSKQFLSWFWDKTNIEEHTNAIMGFTTTWAYF